MIEQQTSHCLEHEKISPFTEAPYIIFQTRKGEMPSVLFQW